MPVVVHDATHLAYCCGALQPKAWYDEPTCIEWALKHFCEDVKDIPGRNLLFCDNLSGQTKPGFQKALDKACNADGHFLTANASDEIQVIDGGIGKNVKDVAQQLLEKKLIEDEQFFLKWTGDGFTASEKRVFITHLCAEAWDIVMARVSVSKIARRTGCLMTIDGSEDDQILPQGLTEYSFKYEDGLIPATNVKGDTNDEWRDQLEADELEETEGGVVGAREEVYEESSDEEDPESDEEEEEVLQVSAILNCSYFGGTLKYLCQYKGYEEGDTSFEPKSNIQPKSMWEAFTQAGTADGTWPPPKPVAKRKKAVKEKPRKRAACPSRNVPGRKVKNVVESGSSGEEEEEEECADASQAQAQAAPSQAAMEVDLTLSDYEPPAPVLTAGVCDFGCPNSEDCECADLTGRLCGEAGCFKRVHHLCLIAHGDNPKKPLYYKKFVDMWPSSAMCKRHCVARVIAHETQEKKSQKK